MNIFNFLLTQPLQQLFLFLAKSVNDAGLTTILFSLIVRIPLVPLYWILHKEEDRLKRIQARIKEETKIAASSSTDKKNKPDFMKQAEVISRVYQEEKFNPLSNFLIQLSPLPILFALFAVFNRLKQAPESLYFLGFINLKQPNVILAAATLALQLLSLKNQPKETRKMLFFSMGLIGIILFTVPAIFTLYWIVVLGWTLLERQVFHYIDQNK